MIDRKEFESKFDVILDASDPDFAEKLANEIGAKSGDVIEFIMPQFERTDGLTVTYIPKTMDDYAALQTYSEDTLKKLGCQAWDGTDKETHWLFPKEWYSSIPDGLDITSISGKSEKFKQGETDDDIRFGCLAYGFIQKHD